MANRDEAAQAILDAIKTMAEAVDPEEMNLIPRRAEAVKMLAEAYEIVRTRGKGASGGSYVM